MTDKQLGTIVGINEVDWISSQLYLDVDIRMDRGERVSLSRIHTEAKLYVGRRVCVTWDWSDDVQDAAS